MVKASRLSKAQFTMNERVLGWPAYEDNNYLGKFVLTGIPKTLRGVPKIKAAGVYRELVHHPSASLLPRSPLMWTQMESSK